MDESPYENLVGERVALERETFISSINSIKPDHRELHELDWGEKQNCQQIEQLEKELSNLTAELIAGKKQIEENEECISKLKKEQEEDGIRIQRLLGLTQPTLRDHTFNHEEAFSGFQEQLQGKQNLRRRKGGRQSNSNGIELPAPDIYDLLYDQEIHQMVLKNVSDQYTSVKNLAMKDVDSLLEDKQKRLANHESNMRDLGTIKKGLECRLQSTQAQLDFMTEKYLDLRRKAVVAYQKSMADKERAAMLQKQMKKDEERIRLQSEMKMHLLQSSMEQDLNLKTKALKTKLHNKEALLEKLEMEYEVFQKEKALATKSLKDSIQKYKQKLKAIEGERASSIRCIVQQLKELHQSLYDLEVLREKEAHYYQNYNF
mmetsp:Transcript_4692/g.6449  ORF Transcript_4692/g.6449 Transcript_4692/m.6449 type:complete len:374 (-) Transcript_4692:221-1342(-)